MLHVSREDANRHIAQRANALHLADAQATHHVRARREARHPSGLFVLAAAAVVGVVHLVSPIQTVDFVVEVADFHRLLTDFSSELADFRRLAAVPSSELADLRLQDTYRVDQHVLQRIKLLFK